MLLRIWRWLWPLEASQTPRRHDDPPLTEDRLELLLDKHMQQITFEWNEWYEKFDKLHLRLAKREKRQQSPQVERGGARAEAGTPAVSALHLRRIGSV